MQQPTERVAADDRPRARIRAWGSAARSRSRLMRAPFVVESAIGRERPLQLSLAQDQQVVQAFLAGGPNPSFRYRVCLGAARWRAHDFRRFLREHAIEGDRELLGGRWSWIRKRQGTSPSWIRQARLRAC